MSLAREDFSTPTWARLMEHLAARRDSLRDQLEMCDLERPQNDHARTLMLRGRIAEVKELLALASKLAPVATERRQPAPLNLT